MLEHQKLIIKNILSDKKILERELEKSTNWLTAEELKQLHYWLINELNSKNIIHIKTIIQEQLN